MKQILVVRKDLTMRRGKEWTQASHASQLAILAIGEQACIFRTKVAQCVNSPPDHAVDLSLWYGKWAIRKIGVWVHSEEELFAVYEAAKRAGLACSLVADEGLTEFKGSKTFTAVAIGPDTDERIDPITKLLKLA